MNDDSFNRFLKELEVEKAKALGEGAAYMTFIRFCCNTDDVRIAISLLEVYHLAKEAHSAINDNTNIMNVCKNLLKDYYTKGLDTLINLYGFNAKVQIENIGVIDF